MSSGSSSAWRRSVTLQRGSIAGLLGGILLLGGCHSDLPVNKPEARWGKGPVIGNVQVEAIFWNADYAFRSAIEGLYPALLGTSYLSTLAEYSTPDSTIGPGSYLGAYQDASLSLRVTQADIQAELERLFDLEGDAGVPTPTADTLYTIFFPSDVTVTFEDATGKVHTSCAGGDLGWCGMHQGFQAVAKGSSVTANYALVVDCPPQPPAEGPKSCQADAECASAGAGFYCDPSSGQCIQNPCGNPGDAEQDWNTVTATRELVDAITDPSGNLGSPGWLVTDDGDRLEIGDACLSPPSPQTAEDLVSGFAVATFFSDDFDACTDNIHPGPYQQLLFYDATHGEIGIAGVDTAGAITSETSSSGFPGLTAIVPGHFFGDAGTDLFLFDGDGGTGQFYNVDAAGNLSQLSAPLAVGNQRAATIVVAGNFAKSSPGVSGLFFYSPAAGTGTFYEVGLDAGAYLLSAIGRGLAAMSPTWTTIKAAELDGNGCTDLLLYDPAGKMAFTTTDCQGNATALMPVTDVEPGYTSVVAGNFLGETAGDGAEKPPLWDVLAYASTSGHVQLWTNRGSTRAPSFALAAQPPFASALATAGWTLVAGQELGGNDFGGLDQADLDFTDLLLFNPDGGILSLATTDGMGDLIELSNSIGWPSTITMVIALRQPLANVQSLY